MNKEDIKKQSTQCKKTGHCFYTETELRKFCNGRKVYHLLSSATCLLDLQPLSRPPQVCCSLHPLAPLLFPMCPIHDSLTTDLLQSTTDDNMWLIRHPDPQHPSIIIFWVLLCFGDSLHFFLVVFAFGSTPPPPHSGKRVSARLHLW